MGTEWHLCRPSLPSGPDVTTMRSLTLAGDTPCVPPIPTLLEPRVARLIMSALKHGPGRFLQDSRGEWREARYSVSRVAPVGCGFSDRSLGYPTRTGSTFRAGNRPKPEACSAVAAVINNPGFHRDKPRPVMIIETNATNFGSGETYVIGIHRKRFQMDQQERPTAGLLRSVLVHVGSRLRGSER